MKEKMSITVDSEKIEIIESLVEKGVFRNKSHAIESALDKMLGGKK
jgi:Arc/MetJ-type ribon-helix-helix transcriptional regulator